MAESIYLVTFREKGTEEWMGPFTFENEADAQRCYQAWATDGIHEAKMETLEKAQTR